MKDKLQKFIVSLLDPNGQISFGRTMAFMSLVAALSWDTANLVFAWKYNHHIPPGMAAWPLLPDTTTMIGQAGFCSTFYGITKIGDLKRISANGSSTEEVEVQKKG